MKISILETKYCTFAATLLALIMVSLISCSDQEKKSSRPVASAKHEQAEEMVAADRSYPRYADKSSSAESAPAFEHKPAMKMESRKSARSAPGTLDEYTVALGADEQLKIPGLPGELRVWIGSAEFKPNFPTRMTQDQTTVPAAGESATVEPYAPAFIVEPAKTQCIKIHPTGSEVRFKLIPQRSGTFEVGANVFLFSSLDCGGSPVPKTAAALKVTVEVDEKEFALDKAKELWNIFWEKLLEFWAALVVLIFGLILFLIRRKLKQWFGYKND